MQRELSEDLLLFFFVPAGADFLVNWLSFLEGETVVFRE